MVLNLIEVTHPLLTWFIQIFEVLVVIVKLLVLIILLLHGRFFPYVFGDS